ncbi:MAG: hypothetical protein ABIO44_08345, partial [Saprospiraceae bacterium]
MKKSILIICALFISKMNAQNIAQYESFSKCQIPSGWSSIILNGNSAFELSKNDQTITSSEGCMLQYVQKDNKDNSRKQFQFISPEYNLISGVNHYLVFNLRYISPIAATFNLSYEGSKGKIVYSLPVSNDFLPFVLTIPSSFNLSKIKFTFEYDVSRNDFGNQIYFDDILFTSDIADCSRAQDLTLASNCIYGHTAAYQYYLSGGQSCSGEFLSAMWYKYQSDYTGLLEFQSVADYNNSVSVFDGTCGSLNPISCNNTDEFGFIGERLEVNVMQGKTYFFKISRKINDFGKENGLHCVTINKLSQSKAKPINDVCENKKTLIVNVACEKNNNVNAGIEAKIPSTNLKSRADVWYSFVAISNNVHEIISHSNFAEVITLYKGSCNALTEIAVENFGSKMSFTPKQGTEYFVQVSGYFSTLEGDLCLEVKDKIATKPVNDLCATATITLLNTQCNEIQFLNDNISTKKPSCVVYNAPDVWYSFVATAEKQVALRIDAGFIYNWAVYEGPCNILNEISCGQESDPCSGYVTVIGLTAGKTYYLQIIAASYPLKPGEGKLCVRIDETSKTEVFQKMRLSLNTECLNGVLSRVSSYSVQGGKSTFVYTGPSPNDFFTPGQEIDAFIDDANGCRAFAHSEASCSQGSKC